MIAKHSLSEEEIGQLAQAMESGEEQSSPRASEVRNYDFIHPDKLSRANLRALQLVYSSLERTWARTLSSAFHNEVTVKLSSVEQASFRAHSEAIPTPGLIVGVSMSPLSGTMLVDMPATLVLGAVDRLAGGRRETKSKPRQLTQLEHTVMKHLMARLIPDLQAAWKPVVNMQADLSESYSSVKSLEIAPEEPMIVAGIVCSAGSTEYPMSIAIPVASVEPILDNLDPQRWLKMDTSMAANAQPVMAELIQSVNMLASAELGHARVSFREVLDMEVGDIVKLDSLVNDPVRITIGGNVRFQAKPGLSGKRLSVQIIHVGREVHRQVCEPSNEAAVDLIEE